MEPMGSNCLAPGWFHAGPINEKATRSYLFSDGQDSNVLTKNLPPTAFAFRQKKDTSRIGHAPPFNKTSPSLEADKVNCSTKSRDGLKLNLCQTQEHLKNCSKVRTSNDSERLRGYEQTELDFVERLSPENMITKSPKPMPLLPDNILFSRRREVRKKSSLPSTGNNSSFSSGDSNESVLGIPFHRLHPVNHNVPRKQSGRLCERCSAELPTVSNCYDYVYRELVPPSHVLSGLDPRRCGGFINKRLSAETMNKLCVIPSDTGRRASFIIKDGYDEPVYEELTETHHLMTANRSFDPYINPTFIRQPLYRRTSSSDSWLGVGNVNVHSRQALLAKTDSGFNSEATPPSAVRTITNHPKSSSSESIPSTGVEDFVPNQLSDGWPYLSAVKEPEIRPRSEMFAFRSRVYTNSELTGAEPTLRRCESLDVPLFAIDDEDAWSRGGDSESEQSSGGCSNHKQLQSSCSRSHRLLTKISRFLLK